MKNRITVLLQFCRGQTRERKREKTRDRQREAQELLWKPGRRAQAGEEQAGVSRRRRKRRQTSEKEDAVDASVLRADEGRGDRRNVQGELHASAEP